jgi:hypothetical protein
MELPHNSSPEFSATDTTSVSNVATSKAEHQRLFRRGMKWLGVGVFLMGSSFGINFLLFDSDTSFVSVMYVLTSLGALCIMKCLADVLGF